MKNVLGSPCPLSIRRPSKRSEMHDQSAIPKQNQDRFIAHRSSMDFGVARYLATEKEIEPIKIGETSLEEAYKRELASILLKDRNTAYEKSRILSFSSKPSTQGLQSILSEASVVDSNAEPSKLHLRHIPQSAERTLDAPGLVDDSHLNLLDWSNNNILSIALGNGVYLWDANRSTASELLTVDDDVGPITSVNWAPDGQNIAVGLTSSDVQLWDSASHRQLRSLKGHYGRVASLSWNDNMLATGFLDGSIISRDVRIRESSVQTYIGHKQEVCGLKWSQSGQQLASGGNDNLLHIWDRNMSSSVVRTRYLYRLDGHCAIVNALSWCPFQSNILASGGGSADNCIKFWNTLTGACLNTIDTDSPVCALLWNKHERELLSSHGHRQNQLTLWKYPSMLKITDLTGHTSRVLHLAQSPDGYTVASAAADETLMFWQIFGTDTSKRTKDKGPPSALNKYLMHIH